jgi:ferritin-like protein
MIEKNNQIVVLKLARNIISEGWCQGYYVNNNQYCISGAISAAVAINQIELKLGNIECSKLLQQIIAELRIDLPIGFRDLIHFNDYPTTTQNDVLNLFDKTIKNLENNNDG